MRILISGAGIAGPTLAYWLHHHGMTPTIVEKAPQLRTGGYIVDFWGAGFDIAEKMGLLPQITAAGYQVQEVRAVNGKGEKVAGFPAKTFARVAQNRFTSLSAQRTLTRHLRIYRGKGRDHIRRQHRKPRAVRSVGPCDFRQRSRPRI